MPDTGVWAARCSSRRGVFWFCRPVQGDDRGWSTAGFKMQGHCVISPASRFVSVLVGTARSLVGRASCGPSGDPNDSPACIWQSVLLAILGRATLARLACQQAAGFYWGPVAVVWRSGRTRGRVSLRASFLLCGATCLSGGAGRFKRYAGVILRQGTMGWSGGGCAAAWRVAYVCCGSDVGDLFVARAMPEWSWLVDDGR